jgi:hypothetical protein
MIPIEFAVAMPGGAVVRCPNTQITLVAHVLTSVDGTHFQRIGAAVGGTD